MTDSGHQTSTTDNGLRVRTVQEQPETEYITGSSRNTRGIQEPTIFLPGEWLHDVLNTIEYHTSSQRLPTPAEHSGQLCKTRSGDTESHSDRASDYRHLNTSAVFRTGETGAYPKNEQPQSYAVHSREFTGYHHTSNIPEIQQVQPAAKQPTATVSTQAFDNSLRVSADTLTAFAIVIIQDTHNTVYDQMETYYQTAHNQATVETPHKAKQLMNSHYNMALLPITNK